MDQRGKRYYYSHPYTPILDSIEEDEELHYTNSYLETYKNDRDDVRTRLMFLSFILFALYFIGPSYMLRGRDIEVIEDIPIIDWTNSSLCVPGEFRSTNELKFERMTLTFRNNIPIDIPIYFTHNLNLMNHKKVTTAVIVQHGNLRNANDYFCGLVNSLLLSQESDTVNIHNYAIIAPQFLTDGDLCWPPSPTDDALDTTIHSHAISIQNKSSWCGFQVWSSEGWKDGHASLDSSLTPPLYSYDVYNLLIERLLDRNYFPALRNITLFGFSAGAQVLLRYATYPNYKVPSNTDSEPLSNDEPSGAVTPVGIKFVISDPSTYLYFDKRRPYVTSVASSEETDSAVVNSATGNTTTNSDSEHSNSNSDTAAAQAHTKSIFSSLFELTQRRRSAPTAKPSSFRSTSYYDTRSRHSSTGSSSNTNTNSNSRTQRSTTRNARVHSSISKSLPLSRVTFGLPNSTWTNLWQVRKTFIFTNCKSNGHSLTLSFILIFYLSIATLRTVRREWFALDIYLGDVHVPSVQRVALRARQPGRLLAPPLFGQPLLRVGHHQR